MRRRSTVTAPQLLGVLMSKELKVRISNAQVIETKLLQIGAVFLNETFFVDTYFIQPPGKVLKIVEKNTGSFVNVFQEIDGTFEVIKDEPIRDVQKMKDKWSTQYGMKRILQGKRKFFQLQNSILILNLIEDVGEFLILTGENPSKDFVEKELGIQNPEYITVSFDELPSTHAHKPLAL